MLGHDLNLFRWQPWGECPCNATYYQWKSKYSGVSASELKRIKELEAENSKLKRMYAELALENTAIKDVLSRKF